MKHEMAFFCLVFILFNSGTRTNYIARDSVSSENTTTEILYSRASLISK